MKKFYLNFAKSIALFSCLFTFLSCLKFKKINLSISQPNVQEISIPKKSTTKKIFLATDKCPEIEREQKLKLAKRSSTLKSSAPKEKVNKDLGIRFHFVGDEEIKKKAKISPEEQKKLIIKILSKLPKEHRVTLDRLTIKFNEDMRRGYGNADRITMRGINMDKKNFIAVFIHELGHLVDLGFLSPRIEKKESGFYDLGKPVFASDPSLDFYRISWKDDENLLESAKEEDFVSGYGATDPFEDFAESYGYFVLHGNDFRKLAKNNKALKRKYLFIKNRVFFGKEFTGISSVYTSAKERPYDSTKLDFSLSRFFAS